MPCTLRVGQLVPGAPKCQHLLRPSQRDSYVRIHSWKLRADQNVVLAKVLNHLIRWMEGVHHDKVRVGIDGLQRPCHCLIKEFLTVICITFHGLSHTCSIVQRSEERRVGKDES